MTDAQLKELTDRLWNERVIFSSKGDPVMFRMHFDSAIREAIEQANPEKREADFINAFWKHALQQPNGTPLEEGFKDSIKAAIEQASQPQVPEGYRLVPEVATWDMIIAATETELTDYSVSPDDETRMTTIGECSAVSIYDAMLEAAPATPENAIK